MRYLNKTNLKNALYAMSMLLFLAACGGGGGGSKENSSGEDSSTTKTDTASNTQTNEPSAEEKAKKDFEENTLKKYPEISENLVRKWKEISFEHKDGSIENVEKANDYLIFKKDGTFEEYFHSDKKIEAGRWRLVKDGKAVHLTSTEHRVMQDVERDIVELTAEKFVWLDNIKKKSTFKAVTGEGPGSTTDKAAEKPTKTKD